MFFVLSKLLYGLLMPASIIVVPIVFSFIVKNNDLKKLSRNIGVVFLLFFTNPFFSSLAINAWEMNPVMYDEMQRTYTYGVLLTGIADPLKTPDDRVHFNKGADRVIHTIELYQKGIIENIIISGGSGMLTDQSLSESSSLKSVLLLAGIPNERITIESKSRNTYENAQFTKEVLAAIGYTKKILLVTSAFHMRRAKACFEKADIEFDYFPTDYYGRPFSFTPDELVVPNVDSLKEWTILTKEWIGYLAYKIVGYA